jgi:lysophospholipase L1-like esterase
LNPVRTVRNQGVNGQTACDLLVGTNGFNDWGTRLRNSPETTVVILNHGINDALSPNAVPVEQYGSCLTALSQIAKAEGKRVIFETPNPVASPGLATYVQMMRQVAAQEGLTLIDQYAYLTQRYGGDASVIAPDGIHPTDAIYIEKGRYAAGIYLSLN